MAWELGVCIGFLVLVLVCTLYLVITKSRSEGWNLCNRHLIFSGFSCITPGFLLAYRAVVFIFFIGVLAAQVVRSGSQPLKYYTVWNYALMMVYFGFAAYHGSRYYLKGGGRYYAERRVARGGKFMTILFQVVFSSSFVVDVVLWSVLYPAADAEKQHTMRQFDSINMHAVNLVVIAGELLMNQLPFVGYHVAYLVFWPVAYCIFQWIIHFACGVDWTYFFMDTDHSVAPAWYAGMLAIHLVGFGVGYALSICKFRKLQIRLVDTQYAAFTPFIEDRGTIPVTGAYITNTKAEERQGVDEESPPRIISPAMMSASEQILHSCGDDSDDSMMSEFNSSSLDSRFAVPMKTNPRSRDSPEE